MLRLLSVSVYACLYIISVVNGDCFDEPPNNGSYDNCATCFQTFANAIINTGDNKYEMSRAFFPIDVIPPVQVQVTYRSIDDGVESQVWYWFMGGFYIFQPLKLFLFRSLFFSPPSWREETLTLHLPNSCFDNDLNETKARDFFRYATQRLKGYAQSQTAIPLVSNSYRGKAVRGGNSGEIEGNIYGKFDVTILKVVYLVPTFSVTVLFTCIAFAGYSIIFNSKETIDALKSKPRTQANIVTTLLLCTMFTSYMIVLDFISLGIEGSDLPSYFTFNAHNIYIFVFILSVLVSIFLILSLRAFLLILIGAHVRCQNSNDKEEIILKSCYCTASYNIGCFAVLFTFHLPNILMAWATDPFYASKIGLYYLIVVFLYFLAFHYSYYLPHKLVKMEFYTNFFKTHNLVPETHGLYALILVSLIVSFVTVTGFIVPILTLVIKIPVNNSLESSADGITNAYDSIIALIVGGLVAYRVIQPYITSHFSFENSLKQAMKDMDIPEITEWKKSTENWKLTHVMKLISEKYSSVERPTNEDQVDVANQSTVSETTNHWDRSSIDSGSIV